MKFMYCNFLGNNLERKNYKGITCVKEVRPDTDSSVFPAETYISGKDLVFVPEGMGYEGKKFDFIGTVGEHEEHTDVNPLIVVATSQIMVFKGTPAHIKYIPVKSGVIVALLSGYIEVAGPDGETMIPIGRNCDVVYNDTGVLYTADSIYGLNSLENSESDVKYSDYVVNDVVIKISASKDGRIIKNLSFSSKNSSVMSPEVFEEGKKKKEAIKKAREEAKRAKEARMAEYLAEKAEKDRLKKEKEEAEAASKKAKKSSPKKSKRVAQEDPVEEEEYTSFAEGAAAFLSFVDSVK